MVELPNTDQMALHPISMTHMLTYLNAVGVERSELKTIYLQFCEIAPDSTV